MIMKSYFLSILILIVLAVGCKKDPYTQGTIVRTANTNCANYLISIDGTIYGTYSLPYKDTAVGSIIFLTYTLYVGDSVNCYQSGHHIKYPYIEVTKIFE